MKRGYVDSDMGQMHYWKTGSGPNLVLLHQSTQTAEEYKDMAPYLADKYTVWAIEWLGHGMTDDPTREPEMGDYTRTVIQAMGALGIDKAALLGHHGGGSICIDIAAQQPDRVTHIVASGTGHRSPEELEGLLKHRTDTAQPEITADGAFLNKMWDIYATLGGPNTPMSLMHRIFLVNMKERMRPYDAHDPILKWNKAEACAKLTCPVLLLQGELDTFVTGQAHLLDVIPDSRRVVMDGIGAFLFYEAPEEIAKVVDEFIEGS